MSGPDMDCVADSDQSVIDEAVVFLGLESEGPDE